MANIEISSVSKRFGDVHALKDLSTSLVSGSMSAIMGPSGAGKSTLLRVVAGLELPDRGTVKIDGVDVCGHPPSSRSIAMLTQDYALYPQQSVEKNLKAAVKSLKLSRQEERERITETLQSLGIERLANRRPNQLSGGERQRAALGRAIVRRPSILLLDEPLSQLDVPLKVELRQLLSELTAGMNITTLAVLHDPLDAMMMADVLYVIEQGRLVQFGAPEVLYRRPISATVVELLSPLGVNWLSTQGHENVVIMDQLGHLAGRYDAIGFRPESARLVATSPPSTDFASFPVTIHSSRWAGESRWVRCMVKNGNDAVHVSIQGNSTPAAREAGRAGDVCWVVVNKVDLLVRSGESVNVFPTLAERPPTA